VLAATAERVSCQRIFGLSGGDDREELATRGINLHGTISNATTEGEGVVSYDLV
jgi:hypothetical protein